MEMLNESRDALLRLSGVEKAFGGTPVLRSFNLDVRSGEVLGLMGSSGCGKSTLLRLVAGLERPDAGEVALAGEVVSTPARLVPPHQRRMGMVFQSLALWPHLTVRQHLEYGLKDLPAPERSERVAGMLDHLQLSAYERRFPHELSGGERQRVALGRALVLRPLVLLCDEPFSSLDRDLRVGVRRLFYQTVRESGTTALFVSHDAEDLDEAERTVHLSKVNGERQSQQHAG